VSRFRYPCTGRTATEGFGAFLEAELGPSRHNLNALARELSATFGAPRVTLTNSGSSANLAAALALREVTGPGEAVVAGFTFPTTLSSLLAAGYAVRAVDTEAGGFGMDPAALEAALTPQTKVVCITHFLGFPARLRELVQLARSRGARVLQDACETMDLRVDGAPAHQLGDLSTWSFYHPHHLSAFGGGAVLSPDEGWQRRVDSVVHWGRACSCHVEGAPCTAPPGMHHQFHYVRRGHNLELSELNACFGRFALRTWEAQERRRLAHYGVLHRALGGVPGVRTWAAPGGTGSPFVFPFQLQGRSIEPFAEAMARRGVEVRSLMGGPVVDQPAYADVPHDGLARCRALAASAGFVGVHQSLPDGDVAEVARLLREELAA
jgi:CDP-6-deoxy-D-xylo-4-hexulose-3-dehydrase